MVTTRGELASAEPGHDGGCSDRAAKRIGFLELPVKVRSRLER